MPETPRTELLAPAGGPAALRAAVFSGADAVYLGLDDLNARRGAENFTRENFADACRLAHLHGAKVYLTANIVVLPGEMEHALETIDFAWGAGVDAVIVQDFGLLRVIREALPHVRVHSSTQMNTHNSATVRALAELGVSRITLGREVSLAEIAALSETGREVGVEIESFVHGALCICYSGQCLLSSMVGGRSANRGMCAQPCRLPYELEDEAGRALGDVGAHLLSPKDLAGIAILGELVNTGVSALKIEGRMKSPEYVALVTGVYRAALDRAIAGPAAYEVRAGELSVLSEAFSRGFTQAYLTGERGNEMMSYRRPNNRGVLIGRIVTATAGHATIALETAVDAEDTIEVWTSRGRFAQKLGALGFGGGTHVGAPGGERVEVALEEPASPGDRVFRVRNASLNDAAERVYASNEGRPVPVRASVRILVGQPLRIEFTDEQGRTGVAEGAAVEAARTKPLSIAEVMEHIGRLGGTPYEVTSWDVDLAADAGMGFSTLHRVRRDAIACYESGLLSAWDERESVSPKLPRPPRTAMRTTEEPAVIAVVGSAEAARACLDAGAAEVHVAAHAWRADTMSDPRIVPVVSRIMHDAQADYLLRPARAAKRAVAGTLGALRLLASEGVDVQGHWSLNALNPWAVALLAESGASSVWLSPELSARQIADVANASAVPLGVAVAGSQELMVTEHCVLMSEGECDRQCASCSRRATHRWLKDRKGYRFPVVTDALGRTHLYNAVPLDVVASLPDVLATGVSLLRIDAELLSPDEAAALVSRVRAGIAAHLAGRVAPKPDAPATTGHFFRGVS
ncbi:MAG TPA: DUF3656 domain-containing protein [Coriobacteriia bacterium]|nr:DUF3656 domain-containing protein [Coriobacteriia bacterium]